MSRHHHFSKNNINSTQHKPESYTQQNINLSDTLPFSPKGLEKIFLTIYFVFLPYIAGLMFLFFYVAEGQAKLFLSLNENSSFILTWAIGYEILAVLSLLYIIKSAISFSRGISRKDTNKKFQIP